MSEEIRVRGDEPADAVQTLRRLLSLPIGFYISIQQLKIDTIRKKSIEALQEYSWPGNVRELQNVIERPLIIVDTNEFSVDKKWLSHEFQSSQRVGPASRISTEQEQIEAALAQSKGKISGRQGAAAMLGMPPSTLESRIRSLKINKFQFKGV